MMSVWLPAFLTALAAFAALLRAVGRPSRSSRTAHSVRVVSLVVILAVFLSASLHRFMGTDHLFFGNDELSCLMAGIRLNLLPWFNLGASLRENFFKSLVMTVHGLGDTVFFAVVVGLFRLLNVPVTEGNLFGAGAALSIASLLLLTLFVRRLFGIGVALVALALAAWNPTLVEFSKTGFQINFIVFLQIASLYGYLLHLSQNRWRYSLLMCGLMTLCGGSELLYLPPLLLVLHAAYARHVKAQPLNTQPGPREACVGLLDRKNVVAWSGYGLALLLNLFLFFKIGRHLDLTLIGHLYVKRQTGTSWFPDYNLQPFLNGFNSTMDVIPGFAYAVAVATGLVFVGHRRSPWAIFFVSYVGLGALLAYFMKFGNSFNFIHLLIPSIVVIALAWTHLVAPLFSRFVRRHGSASELAGILGVAIVCLLTIPWKVRPAPEPPAPYRCMKAVGYVVRELGHPDMRVFLMSDNMFVPMSMEYYLGLSSSGSGDFPTHLFFMREPHERYYPDRLARRLGFNHFDFYVDFFLEQFPAKSAALKDLEANSMHEVARIYDGDALCARVFSPSPSELKAISVQQGEEGFDRTYAYWKNLFYDRHIGTCYYFGIYY